MSEPGSRGRRGLGHHGAQVGDGAAQEAALAHDLVLAHELVQRARADPGRQGSFALHTLTQRVVKQVHAGQFFVN